MVALTQRQLDWAENIARHVVRSLPPSFDLADLVQDAHIAVWNKAQDYDTSQGVPFEAYAYKAVRGAVLMAVRRRNWVEANHTALDDVPDASTAPTAELNIERRESAEELAWALQFIDPRQRQIITGQFLEGLSIDQLSERHHISPSLIFVLRRRGLARLRWALRLRGITAAPCTRQ